VRIRRYRPLTSLLFRVYMHFKARLFCLLYSDKNILPIKYGLVPSYGVLALQQDYDRLIPLAFVALVIENELQYHGLAVRVNSGDDGATLAKTLVNFCLITPEMTGLICVRLV